MILKQLFNLGVTEKNKEWLKERQEMKDLLAICNESYIQGVSSLFSAIEEFKRKVYLFKRDNPRDNFELKRIAKMFISKLDEHKDKIRNLENYYDNLTLFKRYLGGKTDYLNRFVPIAEDIFSRAISVDTNVHTGAYANAIAESAAYELVTQAGLGEEASYVEESLKKTMHNISLRIDESILARNFANFEIERKNVSENIGKTVLPIIFEIRKSSLEEIKKLGVQDMVHIALEFYKKNKESENSPLTSEEERRILAMESEDILDALKKAGCNEMDKDTYPGFDEKFLKLNNKGAKIDSGAIVGSLIVINSAWRSVQLGRGIFDNFRRKETDPKDAGKNRITVGGNYGTFTQMMEGSFKRGYDNGGPEVGVLRLAYELSKDLVQMQSLYH